MERLRFKDENGNEFSIKETVKLRSLLRSKSLRNKNEDVELVLTVNNKKGFITQQEQFEDRRVASKNISNYKIVEKDDFAYNPARINVGSIARLKNFEKGIVSPMYNVFETNKKLDSTYFEYFLETLNFKNQMKRYLVGSVRQTLDMKSMELIKLNFPSLNEQEKIGGFLSAFDRLIEKQREKVELLLTEKKGNLDSIFNNLSSNHKAVKLKDIGKFSYGKSAPKWSVSDDGETHCVRYGELYSGYGEEIEEVFSRTTINPKSLKLSKGGEVLIPRVGENPLDFANCSVLRKPNVAIGEMIAIYETTEDPLYMVYLINTNLKRAFAKVVEGASVSNLYYKYYESFEVKIHSKNEQKKIVSLLKGVDKLIRLENRKLSVLLKLKKGYLQRLFHSE